MLKKWLSAALAVLFVLGFIWISGVPRDSFFELVAGMALLFGVYAAALIGRLQYASAAVIAVFLLIRIPFFFHLPLLSDDFYRFLWDGMLINEGFLPWGRVPVDEKLFNFHDPNYARLLLANMNSSEYASVYPPFNQVVFGISHFLAGPYLKTGVNIMRSLFVLVELVFFILLYFRSPDKRRHTTAYLLNPLVVTEGVGNLHFEAFLIPFLAYSLLVFDLSKYKHAAVLWATSILIKLTPLILAPALFFKTPRKKRLSFVLISVGMVALFTAMLQPLSAFEGLDNGIGLYFFTFEFNASIYYLLSLGLEQIVGYNPIGFLGPALGVLTLAVIVAISYKYRRAGVFELALVVYIVFLLLSTTVHPWYLIPVVLLAICADRHYILAWSFAVFLSYSHYFGDIGPKWYFLMLEYGILFVAVFLEGRRKKWLQPALRG